MLNSQCIGKSTWYDPPYKSTFYFYFFLKRELFFILTKNKGIYVILFKFEVCVIINYLDPSKKKSIT
jgi:hypothetical protein